MVLAALAASVAAAALAPELGLAKPCGAHEGKAKTACLKQYKRDKQAWPKNPKAWEIKRRVGAYNWYKAHRVANCETGGTRGATRDRGNQNWYIKNGRAYGTYVGPLGMYIHTFNYGRRVTKYQGKSWPEFVAIAVGAHKITGGWNGWGCRGA